MRHLNLKEPKLWLPLNGSITDKIGLTPLTSYNILWGNGVNGQAMSCDATSRYITSTPGDTTYNLTPVSFEVLVYPKADSGVIAGVVTGSCILNNENGQGYALYYGNGTKFDFFTCINGSQYKPLWTPTAYPINRWYHIICSASTTAKRLYVNGVLVASAGAGLYQPVSSSGFQIGSFHAGQRPFNGLISNVKIYNSEITDKEAAILYHGRRGVVCG